MPNGMEQPNKLYVFLDADVLIAGSISPSDQSASLVLLRMAEITLIQAVVSEQVVAEVERNLLDRLPAALPAMRLIMSRCLRVVPDPPLSDLEPHRGIANPNDLPILVAAVRESCPWLVTFNLRQYQPGHAAVRVVRPGEFLQQVRSALTNLAPPRHSAH